MRFTFTTPPDGYCSATPGLGKRMSVKMKVIYVIAIIDSAFCYRTFTLSNENPIDPIYGGRYLADENSIPTTK
jgi:hypothetical protein